MDPADAHSEVRGGRGIFEDESAGFDTALLLSLIFSLPDALVVVELPQRTITAFNPAACEMFGYRAEEVLGRSTRVLHVDDEGYRTFDEEGREELAAEGIFRGCFKMRRADGAVFPTEHTVCYVDEKRRGAPPRYAVSLIRDVTERVGRERELEDQQQALRSLNRRLLGVQEAERRSFARDLHDQMGQELGALRLALASLKRALGKAEDLDLLERCQGVLEEMEHSVRSLVLDLRPPMLDDLGLGPTLRWYLGRRLRDQDIEGRLYLEEELPKLSEAVRTTAFRVVQESLNNAIHHAEASQVEIRVERVEDKVHLEVRDDGRGFELGTDGRTGGAGESLGLLGMAERAELVGGTLSIETAPGQGTAVHLLLPADETPDGETS